MNVNIKVHLIETDSFHREQISRETSFSDFLNTLDIDPLSIMNNKHSSSLIVEYMDEESDWIRVNNEEQWSHALLLHTTISSSQNNKSYNLFRLRIRPNYQKKKNTEDEFDTLPSQLTIFLDQTTLQQDNKTNESYPLPPPPPAPPIQAIQLKKNIFIPPPPNVPFSATKVKNPSNNIEEENNHDPVGPISCGSPSTNQTSLQSLQEAINNARNNLKSINIGASLVQDYFTPSGVTKTDFLRELSAKIQSSQLKKHLSTREEYEMVKDVKQGLHEELLRKCKRQNSTAKSNLGSSSPLLEELLRRHKQFSNRQVQRRDDFVFSEYEIVDHLKVVSIPHVMEPSSASWITSILSKFTF